MIFIFRLFQSWVAEAITIVRTNRLVATRNVLIPVQPNNVAELRERNHLDINANALTVSNYYFSYLIIQKLAPMDPLSLQNSRIFQTSFSLWTPRTSCTLCISESSLQNFYQYFHVHFWFKKYGEKYIKQSILYIYFIYFLSSIRVHFYTMEDVIFENFLFMN